MTQVTIDGITYNSKIEAVRTLFPNANVKSGSYVTLVDKEARKRYLEKCKNTMNKKYNECPEYREKHKKQCLERYHKKKLSEKISFS